MSYIIEALQELEYLAEDIASFKNFVSKQYPKANLSDNIIDTLIELDPTYVKGSNSKGNYADWIVRLYAKGIFKEDDFYKVTEYLKEFEQKKSNFENKDINQFKSLPELAQALDKISLSQRQETRTNQNARKNVDLNKEAELVYEDSRFEVWIPKTYAASCKLGENTRWCTATTESDDYYRQYSGKGPLFIFISKRDPKDKYQFHFESGEFMDSYDQEINFSRWNSDYLRKVFSDAGYEKYANVFVEDLVIPEGTTEIDLSHYIKGFIKSVKIPSSVKEIGAGAFQYCKSLQSITIPDSVTKIGKGAFFDCILLRSVEIPNSVIEICEEAFALCTSLQLIKIPDSVKEMGKGVFAYGSDDLTIKCKKDSYADEYARENNIRVKY